VGPGTVLRGLIRKIHKEAKVAGVAEPGDMGAARALLT